MRFLWEKIRIPMVNHQIPMREDEETTYLPMREDLKNHEIPMRKDQKTNGKPSNSYGGRFENEW